MSSIRSSLGDSEILNGTQRVEGEDGTTQFRFEHGDFIITSSPMPSAEVSGKVAMQWHADNCALQPSVPDCWWDS